MSSNSNQTNAGMMDPRARDLAALQQLNLAPTTLPAGVMNQYFKNNVQFGNVPNRQVAVIDDGTSIKQKFMGLGTDVNTAKGYFNTKETVLLVPEWRDNLNALLQEELGRATQVSQTIPDYTIGLYGNTGNGFAPYFSGVRQYYADDRARVSISAVAGQDNSGNIVQPFLLPGSTAARAANAAGFAVGLAYIKSPFNRTGYIRAGSNGWRNSLAKWAKAPNTANRVDVEHFFAQAGVYGLGPVFRAFGYDVVPVAGSGQGSLPVRYRLNGQDLMAAINDGAFMRSVQGYYNANLKNPDQVRLGVYGSTALKLRHADKMTLGQTGTRGGQDIAAFNAAVTNAVKQNGTSRGFGKWGTGADNVNYANFQNRIGLAAFPMRRPDGQPVSRQQSSNINAGECTIWNSGPGVSGNATLGGAGGYHFTKKGRRHTSSRSGNQGTLMGTTYSCAFTPDYVVNPNRDIYKSAANGGLRGTQDMSLSQVLDAYQPGLAEKQVARYADWANNPQKYGTNPLFTFNPIISPGRKGFSRAAPDTYRSALTPEEQARFNTSQLTLGAKQNRSANLAQAIASQAPLTVGKTSPPNTFNFTPADLRNIRVQ